MTYLSGLKNIYNFSLEDALENWNMQSFLFSSSEKQVLAVTEGLPINDISGGSKIEQFIVFLLCHIWRADVTYFMSWVEIWYFWLLKKKKIAGKVNLLGTKGFQLWLCNKRRLPHESNLQKQRSPPPPPTPQFMAMKFVIGVFVW